MPAGVSWTTYLKLAMAAGLSMVAGAQTVHHLYRPLDDLDEWKRKFEEEQARQQRVVVEAQGERRRQLEGSEAAAAAAGGAVRQTQ